MDAIKVKLIGLSRGGGGNLQPDKTATPTEQEQTVRADPGYDGLRQVTVEAIPDQYADVSGVDAGAGDVRVGKVIVGSDGEPITGTMPPQKPEEIGHATPTEQAQTVTPTAGSVFSEFEVGAIPSEYADVSGVDATAADVRTGKKFVDAQGDTITGEMEPQKPEQVKNATPTTSPQSVTPDTGYALSRVDVGAIPSEYADVSDTTATPATVLSGEDFYGADGTKQTGACTFDADTSDADATAGQIEAGATAYVGGAKVTGTMPIRTTDVEIDSLSPVPIPAGSYDGTVEAKIDDAEAAKIVPANIKKDVEIFGQVGAYEGVDTLAQYFADTLESVVDDVATSVVPELFKNKNTLKSVKMSKLLTVSNTMFGNATGLESVEFPAATTFDGAAFSGCTALTDISADNVTRFEGNAFSSCTSLAHINADKVTYIGANCFRNCTALTAIDLPLLTSYGYSGSGPGTFAYSGVASLKLPSVPTLTSQGAAHSIVKNSNITMLDCDICTTIQGSGLYGGLHLVVLILRADTVCTLSSINAFNSTPFSSNGTGGTLYVPQNLISQYEQATNWSVILAYPNNQILPIEGSPYEVTT